MLLGHGLPPEKQGLKSRTDVHAVPTSPQASAQGVPRPPEGFVAGADIDGSVSSLGWWWWWVSQDYAHTDECAQIGKVSGFKNLLSSLLHLVV